MFNTKDIPDPMSGYKFALNTQNVSDEVKGQGLDQDVGDDQANKQKDQSSVAAGPKAAQHSPGGINLGKTKAYQELLRKGGETPEEY
ncbi:hypothetical protein EN45_043200 [Penicillium chrysogenum]|uniref:Conidiation-specific protein n=3 Tax=Penicillium TaxID=5073 RepID=A0A167YHN1_PENCH|nr:hypothetical protein NUH16_005078 [Penicillium rubens]KZN94132.1 hypothetical protein EN45_043200 [Penicillium chrysogenum]CDM32704.1 hypothetical protein PROQFM164_S02g002855 [Penicillium roqueforti FM164]CRL31444.1 unnamed protein product [Penicillium camemberti]